MRHHSCVKHSHCASCKATNDPRNPTCEAGCYDVTSHFRSTLEISGFRAPVAVCVEPGLRPTNVQFIRKKKREMHEIELICTVLPTEHL